MLNNDIYQILILIFLSFFPAGARRLRILLSFAVGGLLGDVFLHLLPEAWEHRVKAGNGNELLMQWAAVIANKISNFFYITQ